MILKAKTVKESIIETNDIVHPSDVNAYGFCFWWPFSLFNGQNGMHGCFSSL
jgi:hypothetical protein